MKLRPELGQKHICPSCKTKYYDMGQDPATCPRCEHVHEVMTKALARRSKKNAEKEAQIEADKAAS
jgi:uncharacterized protein (TIGR02300 family)